MEASVTQRILVLFLRFYWFLPLAELQENWSDAITMQTLQTEEEKNYVKFLVVSFNLDHIRHFLTIKPLISAPLNRMMCT